MQPPMGAVTSPCEQQCMLFLIEYESSILLTIELARLKNNDDVTLGYHDVIDCLFQETRRKT